MGEEFRKGRIIFFRKCSVDVDNSEIFSDFVIMITLNEFFSRPNIRLRLSSELSILYTIPQETIVFPEKLFTRSSVFHDIGGKLNRGGLHPLQRLVQRVESKKI